MSKFQSLYETIMGKDQAAEDELSSTFQTHGKMGLDEFLPAADLLLRANDAWHPEMSDEDKVKEVAHFLNLYGLELEGDVVSWPGYDETHLS